MVSIIIPVYNDPSVIARAIASVVSDCSDEKVLEIIVVDDGSDDITALQETLRQFNFPIILLPLEENRGKAAAVNAGLKVSKGDFVLQLDADDYLVDNWFSVLQKIVEEKHQHEINFFLSHCLTNTGEVTVEVPDFQGIITYTDRLQGKYPGEYFMIFRGDFIRQHLYVDLAISHAGYEEYSYLRLLRLGTGYVVKDVLRVYETPNAEGLSGGWWKQKQASERAIHLEHILRDFGNDFQVHAPRELRKKYLRLAVYRRFGKTVGVLTALKKGVSLNLFSESLGACVLLLIPIPFARYAVSAAKKFGLVERWG